MLNNEDFESLKRGAVFELPGAPLTGLDPKERVQATVLQINRKRGDAILALEYFGILLGHYKLLMGENKVIALMRQEDK